MPQMEENNSRQDRSSRSITALWRNFHFSGRVIVGSVFFGFGLLLIGALIFIINMNDDSTKTPYDHNLDPVSSKPPKNVVGPVVMGIGGFIMISGITMCLFETQICKKKTGDSRPLISNEVENINKNDLESAGELSSSHKHRHKNRKSPASPKRSKGHHGKSRSKERNQQKSPSPRSPPVAIETSKGFMTSSEERFLTPPNTFDERTALVHNSSRDAENQKSSSLMKSFTSSGPSWNQSTEFQTPSTSFGDSSVSLNNSIEVGGKEETGELNTASLIKPNADDKILNPIMLVEKKLHEMSAKIQNQKKNLSDTQGKGESDMNSKSIDQLSDTEITCKEDPGSLNAKVKECKTETAEENIQRFEETETKTDLLRPLTVQNAFNDVNEGINQTAELTSNDAPISHKNDLNSALETVISVAGEKQNEKELRNDNDVVSKEEHHIKLEYEHREKFNTKDNIANEVSQIRNNEKNSSIDEEENSKIESTEDDEEIDLESSVSSNETVVSQGRILKMHANIEITEKKELEPQEISTDKAVTINTAESTNVVTPQKDVVNLQSTQSSLEQSEAQPSDHYSQSEEKKIIEDNVQLSNVNSS